MKIVITGATGFVGKYLIKYFESTQDRIVTKSVRYVASQQFDFEDSDAIIHLSGKAHDLKKNVKKSDYEEANFKLTKQLYDSFLKSKASVFIFLSTVKAVADTTNQDITEETIPSPKTYYGISKLKAEYYIFSREIPKGKRVFILRPCMIHGPGNKGNLILLSRFFSKGLPWALGSFKNKRSFLSVENLSFIIKEILQNNSCLSGIYNVADNEPVSTNELIRLLAKAHNKREMIWNIPTFLIKCLAKLGDVLHLQINSERLQKLTENYIVSNHKIIKAIGKELPVSTKEGLIKTFQSFN